MNCKKEFFKNSNTGEIIMKQSYENSSVDFPDDYFDVIGERILGIPDLTGFVPISERKYVRAKVKVLRKNKK